MQVETSGLDSLARCSLKDPAEARHGTCNGLQGARAACASAGAHLLPQHELPWRASSAVHSRAQVCKLACI